MILMVEMAPFPRGGHVTEEANENHSCHRWCSRGRSSEWNLRHTHYLMIARALKRKRVCDHESRELGRKVVKYFVSSCMFHMTMHSVIGNAHNKQFGTILVLLGKRAILEETSLARTTTYVNWVSPWNIFIALFSRSLKLKILFTHNFSTQVQDRTDLNMSFSCVFKIQEYIDIGWQWGIAWYLWNVLILLKRY